MSLRSPLVSYDPEAVWNARRALFDGGGDQLQQVNAAVLRSWMRCRALGRDPEDEVDYAPVERAEVTHLLERNHALVDAARPELASLARSVAEAGYGVMLTDVSGNALVVDGAIASLSPMLRRSFRVGVDLSEAAVGTSAMSVAMSEGKAVSVCGAEHYYASTHVLQCCAAPVFDPLGEVFGAVDVTHDMPGMLQSALWLAERCAHRIERRLFQRLPARLRLEIDVDEGDAGGGFAATQAWLALGRDGELLAASRSARQLLGLPAQWAGIDFESLVGERFDGWRARWRGAVDGAPLVLQNGIRLRARAMAGPSTVSSSVSVSSATAVARRALDTAPCFGDTRLDQAFARALRAFRADLPILVTGETGCGKDVAARAFHACGPRAAGPLVTLNCAAIPGEVLAGELFGHVEGAFTGARRGGAPGKIEAANGGTLFLDEIGDMPLHLQAMLLRVLDTREVVRLGEAKARPVDLHIVCATHRDLRTAVSEGRFREDLLYRITGHELHLMPLRERRDFNAIIDTLLVQSGEVPARVPAEVRLVLRSVRWPGNVRQLAHALRRAIALADPGAALSIEDFEIDEDLQPPGGATSGEAGLLWQAQSQAISRALQDCDGNVTQAAQRLGIGRATLYRKLATGRKGGT